MRKLSIASVIAVCFSACSADLPHEAPYDEQAPLGKQARASLKGKVELEGESDHSQVSVQLVNAERTYSVSTHADGSLEITGVAPGKYRITYETRYFVPQSEEISVDMGAAADLGTRTLVARRSGVRGSALVERLVGSSLKSEGGVVLTLEKSGSIRLAGAKAPEFRFSASTTAQTRVYTALSSSDGRYAFSEVPAGTYRLLGSAAGLEPAAVASVTVTGEHDVAVADVVLKPLTGYFTIEGTANGQVSTVYTQTPAVTLKLAGFNAERMKIAQSADGTLAGCTLPATGIPFSGTQALSLTGGDGKKLVCVRFIDVNGKETETLVGSITLDQAAPGAVNLTAVAPSGYVNASSVLVNVSAADAVSGVQAVRYSTSAAGVTAAVATPYQPTLQLPLAADGSYTYWLQVLDAAGNASAPQSITVVRDTAAPVLGVIVKSGGVAIADNASVGSTRLTLQVTGADASPLEMQIVNNGVAGAWEPYGAVRGVELDAPSLPAGEGRSLVVRLRDAAGNQATAFTFNVVVDTLGPTAPNLTLASSLVSDTTVGVTLAAVGASEVELSGDISFLAPVRFAYTTTSSYTVAAGDGPKTIYARFLDAVGNASAVVAASTALDQTPPQNPSLAILQSSPTRQNPLGLSLSATGADLMSVTEGACGNVWEAYAQSKNLTLGSTAEGTKTVAVRFKDQAGNVSACVTQTVYFDANPPTLLASPVQINYGAASTSNGIVTVSFNVAGATQVKVSEDSGLADAAWQPLSANRTLALSASNGTKTVYAQFRDDAGNTTAVVNDTIVLDTTPVSVPYVTIQADATTSTSVLVSLAASNVDEMMLSENASFAAAAWQPYVAVTTVTFSSGDGVKTLYAKFRKTSGAESSAASDTYILDTTGPQLPAVSVNNGSSVVSSNIVTLSLTAVDPTSGVAAYKINTADAFGAVIEHAFQTTDLYTLMAGDGVKTLWVTYRDRAGNYSSAVSTTVLLDSTAPSVSSVAVQKLDGSAITNGATVRDGRIVLASSVSDLTNLEMQVTTNGSYAGLGWEPYSSSKVIDLTGASSALSARVRDAAGQVTTLITGFTVNLDNRAPTLTFNRSSASPTNNLAVSLSLSASESSQAQVSEDPGFTGAPWFDTANTAVTLAAGDGLRTIYARARDAAGNVSDVKTVQVTIDQTAPQGADFTITVGVATNNRTVGLTFTAIGASEVRAQEGAACGGTYATYGSSGSVTLTSPLDGTKSINVQYRDAVGNETACLTKSIVLDETPPVVASVVIDGNAPYTTDRVVSVEIASVGATQMQVAENSSFAGASWQPVTSSVAWTLSAGEGNKTIFARFRDDANNVVTGFSDTILVDTIAPTFNSLTTPFASAVTGVTLALTASGADEMRLSEIADFSAAAWVPFNALAPFALANVQGGHTVYAQLRDTAGNVSIVRSVNVALDSQAPANPLVAILGGGYTKVATVSLQTVADGASEMLVSQYAPMTDATWQPFAQLKTFVLAGSDGVKTVYVKVRDAAGNESGQGSATVILDSTSPSVSLFRAQDSGGNVISSTNQLRYFLRLEVSDVSPVTVQYAPTNVFVGVSSEGYSALRAWDVAAPTNPAGEVRSAYVRIQDAAGNFTVAGPVDVAVDSLGPTAPNLTLSASLVSSPTVNVNLSAADASWVEISGDISFLSSIRFVYQATTTYTFTTGDGVKTLYARYSDALGNHSPIVSATATLDTMPPENPAFTIAQASPTQQVTLDLTMFAGGAAQMAVNEGACGSSWETYSQHKTFLLSSAANMEADKTIFVRFRDAANNFTDCLSKTLRFDNRPPTIAAAFQINYGAAFTTNSIVTLTAQVAGADEMQVSENDAFADAVWLPYSASRTFTLSSGDGPKTVYARFRDRADNRTAAVSGVIQLDTTPPLGSVSVLTTSPANSLTVNVALSANETSYAQVSTVSSFAGAAWFATQNTTFTVAPGDGAKLIYVRFRDLAGNVSATQVESLLLDTQGPAGTRLSINGGATYVKNSAGLVDLTLTAFDTNGVVGMKIANLEAGTCAAALATAPPSAFIGSLGWVLSSPGSGLSGSRTVCATFVDGAQNWSTPVSATVNYDTQAPLVVGSGVYVEGGEPYANSQQVTLALAATGATQMMLYNDGAQGGAVWEPFRAITAWFLPAVQGNHTVWVLFSDEAGNVVGPYTAAIILDTVAPTNVGVAINGGAGYANATTVALTLTAVGADFVHPGNDGVFAAGDRTAYSTGLSWSLLPGDGVKTVAVIFSDAAGNETRAQTAVILDTTPPDPGTVVISGSYGPGASYTTTPAVTLGLNAVGAVYLSINASSCNGAGAWQPYSNAAPYTLPPPDGTKNVYVRLKDEAGNFSCASSSVVLDTILYAPAISASVRGPEGSAAGTRSQAVTLRMAGLTTDVAQIKIANDPYFTAAAWQTPATAVSWTLAPGAGYKTIYVQARDSVGHTLAAPLQTTPILYDPTVPAPSVVLAPRPVRAGTMLWAQVLATNDPDDSTLEYSYQWYRNGASFPAPATQDTIAASNYHPHDTWKVVVTPFDRIGQGVTGWAQTQLDFPRILSAVGAQAGAAATLSGEGFSPFGIAAVEAGGYHTCLLTNAGGVKCWGYNAWGQLGNGSVLNQASPVDVVGLTGGVAQLSSGHDHSCVVTTVGGVKCWGRDIGNAPVDIPGLGAGVAQVSAGQGYSCALLITGGVKCWGKNPVGNLGDGSDFDRATPVDVVGLSSGVIQISAGGGVTCAVLTGGGAKCWGGNISGSVGNGTTVNQWTPVDVTGLSSGVAEIKAGGTTCARMVAGGVKCWGWNYYGQVGNGTTVDQLTPVDVTGLAGGVGTVSVGSWHNCALLTTGGVKCWGRNALGILGNGNATNQSTPVDVNGLSGGVTRLSVGEIHACVVSAGTVQCWGTNDFSQLGNWAITNQGAPSPITGLSERVAHLSAGGNHTCAVTAAGGVKCWGWNSDGQLGNGNYAEQWTAVTVSGLASGVAQVASGYRHTCAVTVAGGAKCWGMAGVLGIASPWSQNTPVDVTGLGTGVAQVVTGQLHSCALLSTGGVKCWGSGYSGQLGNGAFGESATPIDVSGLGSGVKKLASGSGLHTCALLTGGSVKCWGLNNEGQLGDGTVVDKNVPTDVTGLASGVADIAVGRLHSCALLNDGTMKCWGRNYFAQLGDGGTTRQSSPVSVVGLAGTVVRIAAGETHSCAVLTSGREQCWGSNWSGEAGTGGAAANQPTPAFVAGGDTVSQIALGSNHSCAVLAAGGMKCWGYNPYGQLGNGNKTTQYVPVGVYGFNRGILQVAVGGQHVCTLLNSGGVRCWGLNGDGRLGNGNTTDQPFAVDVSGLEAGVVQISSGADYSCALLATSGVKCWGANANGQLGNGNTVDQHVPAAVSGLSFGVAKIVAGGDHACALMLTGGVKCWGNNGYGQLGRGDMSNQSVPSDVAGMTSGVSDVAVGANHTCALLSSGAVQCWGRNNVGQIGNGGAANQVLPTAVASLSSGVTQIVAGGNHTCVLLAAGLVKCWGLNDSGQLGNGTTANLAVPSDVGGLAGTVTQLGAGAAHSCARMADGAVYCWGGDNAGQMGDGDFTSQKLPRGVIGIDFHNPAASLALGGDASCVVLADQQDVSCWGNFNAAAMGGQPLREVSINPYLYVDGGMLAYSAASDTAIDYTVPSILPGWYLVHVVSTATDSNWVWAQVTP